MGVRMGPVERSVALHLLEHEGRIHAVAVDEHPLLEVRHDRSSHRLAHALVGLEGCDERAVGAVGEAGSEMNAGVGRAGIQEHPAEHPHERLVRAGSVLLDQIEGLHHGRILPQVSERVGGRGDRGEAVDGLLGRHTAGHVAEQFAKLPGQPGLVIPVLAIALAPDLVEVDPAEFHRQVGVVGIERDAPCPQQVDRPVDPAPALLGHSGRGRDVVGQIPGLEGPHPGKPRLQGCDPLAQCLGFVVEPFGLEGIGPHPEGIDGQPAEATQARGRQRYVWRHPLRVGERDDQRLLLPLAADRPGQPTGAGEGRNEHGDGNGLDRAV